MKTSILTMSDYNAIAETSLRFRNVDGTLKTKGFVVKNHSNATPFTSLKKAEEASINYMPVETVTDCHLTNYSN